MAYFRRRGALRAIFQHNAHLVETVARRIRRRPVFRFACVQTLLDERFDLRHFRVVNLRAALQERLRLLLQQTQHRSKLTQVGRHGVRRGRVLGFQAVYFTRHIEQHRIGFRGVEVVVHRLDKACFEGFAPAASTDLSVPRSAVYRRSSAERACLRFSSL